MEIILGKINSFVWGIPVLVLILGLGIKLTLQTGFLQIFQLPSAMRKLFGSIQNRKTDGKETSAYRAMCTALAATVGTGNIAGVAGAIALGGPGVIFWMWICAILGMIIKYTEVVLAIRYRQRNESGEFVGGPMYIIKNGLPVRLSFLAYAYCFFGVVAALGVGNATQVNAVANGIVDIGNKLFGNFPVSGKWLVGAVIALLIYAMFRKGTGNIGACTEKLIPFAAAGYLLLSVGVLAIRFEEIPTAFSKIIRGAFAPRTFTCGMISSAFLTLRIGLSRGVFTNEAGMGTASIAHASATNIRAQEQGLLGIVEVFLDTIVICTLTALVILCSGVPIHYGTDPGIALTLSAFAQVYGNWSGVALTVFVCLFAFATILGWGFYGVRCAQFLFGIHAWKPFILVQAVAAFLGTVLDTAVVWSFAETVNGLMAIPNLIALYFLIPEFQQMIAKK